MTHQGSTTSASTGLILKWIELEQFLSFKKARISLGIKDGGTSRFSIITGPNGAGKSAVFHALKFVLGSNAKDGRYAKWEGFINTGGDFMRVRAGFRAADGTSYEIERLFRRGQGSSFYLNGKHVNATTLNSLVEHFRIFPDNIFSFVAQGHVNRIKDLSAREVYGLIEDGMGLAGLRDEIEVNARKVAELQADLDRLRAQKETCSKHQRVLEGQMAKLAEKRQLERELLGYRAERSWAQKDDIARKIDAKQAEASAKQAESRSVGVEKDALVARIDEVTREREAVEADIGTKQAELATLKAEQSRLVEEVGHWDKAKQELHERNEQLKRQKDEATRALDEMGTRLRDASAERDRDETRAREHASNLRGLQDAFTRLSNDLVKNQDWIDEHERVKRDVENERRDMKQNEHKLDDTEAEIKSLIEDINEFSVELRQVKWDYSADGKRDLQALLAQEIKEIDAGIKQKEDARVVKKRIEADLLRELGRGASTLEDERRTFKEVELLKQDIQRRGLQNDIKGPIHEFMEFDPVHARAIEAQFKKHGLLGFISFSTENFNLLNSLRKKYKAPATIYHPGKIAAVVQDKPPVNFPGVVDYLYKLIKVPAWLRPLVDRISRDTIVVETFSDAVKLVKLDDRARCITLDGVIVEARDDVVESQPPYFGPLILTAHREEDDSGGLSMRASIVAKEIAALDEQIDRLRQQRNDKERRQGDLVKIRFFLKQKEIKSTKKNQLLADKDDIKQRIDQNAEEIQRLLAEQRRVESQRPREILLLKNELSATKARLEEAQARGPAIDGALQEARSKVNEVEKARHEAEIRFNAVLDEHERLKIEIRKNASEVREIGEKIDAIKAQAKACVGAIDSSSERKQELGAVIKEKSGQLNELELKLKVLAMERERACQEIASLEREQDYIDSNLKGQMKPEQLKTVEEYDLLIARVGKKLASPDFFCITDAIEREHEENCRVMAGISAKMDEIGQEVSKLDGIGDRLKETYVERIGGKVQELEGLVNAKFTELGIPFRPVLAASGGFADPAIDVSVDFFSGTRLPLAAVSEGQKSIIALGIMLTLQDLNPGPICVFDEAHIYLDDSNKELISRLIRKTTEHVQLIMLVPTTSHGFIKSADKIIAIVRQGMKFANGDTRGKELNQLGPSRVIELDEQEFTRMVEEQ
ncbi:MAG: AAA family ATPase [Candidatus Lokiarchaeota archaeon]|nr:AAA family ATPase [Candidatus Lokiarchaeota archaeon]